MTSYVVESGTQTRNRVREKVEKPANSREIRGFRQELAGEFSSMDENFWLTKSGTGVRSYLVIWRRLAQVFAVHLRRIVQWLAGVVVCGQRELWHGCPWGEGRLCRL